MKVVRALVIGIACVLISCGKDPSGIPDVAVNFHMPLSQPALFPLSTPGGAVQIDGYGVAGIIVYHSPFSNNSYLAYDRCSSVNPEQRCAVKVDGTGLTATDPCSGGVFSLEDGTAVKAPAKKPLKRYSVSISNGTLLITN